MSALVSGYRLDGIYKQRQEGFFMQRVKLAAGVISSLQARTVAQVSARFGKGTIHLTSRGSMEIHWLREESLPLVKRELAKAGLTSRGACGGAVRGISCGSQGARGFPALESLARRLQRHFTGNPRFETLPKKFKIGIEADAAGGRHLIQDVGLVLARQDGGRTWYDIWIAGGLGREPQPAFLLAEQVPEERIIPIIEAIVRVYASNTPPPKRLKFLANQRGEAELRRLIEADDSYNEELPESGGIPEYLVQAQEHPEHLDIPVFAGNLTSEQLSAIADIADNHADGVLMVTPDQDIVLQLAPHSGKEAALNLLQQTSGMLATAAFPAVLRVCPGNHECSMGLIPTRDVATELIGQIKTSANQLSWALSGCPNSCSQPQLAEVGIVATRMTADADGRKSPRFDMFRRNGTGLGQKIHEGLTREELFSTAGRIAEV